MASDVYVSLTRPGSAPQEREARVDANGAWSCEFHLFKAGKYVLRVRPLAGGEATVRGDEVRFVFVDDRAPAIQVPQPPTQGTVNGTVLISGTCDDASEDVQLEIELARGAYSESVFFRDASGPFSAEVPVRFLGEQTYRVKAFDGEGNAATPVEFVVKGSFARPPRIDVLSPAPGSAWNDDVDIQVAFSDADNVVTGIFWRWQGGQWQVLIRAGDRWRRKVKLPKLGALVLEIEARDRNGDKVGEAAIGFDGVSADSYPDLSDITSRRNYLDELLRLFERSVTADGSALTTKLLEQTLLVDFSPIRTDALSLEPVSEARLLAGAIERWLRGSLSLAQSPAALTDYETIRRWFLNEAYKALLKSIGTSFEEVRRAEETLEGQRVLAKQLSIALDRDASGLTTIRRLLLARRDSGVPQATEEDLGRVFGYQAATSPGSLPPAPMYSQSSGGQFAEWRRSWVRQRWLAEDQAAGRLALDPEAVRDGEVSAQFQPTLAYRRGVLGSDLATVRDVAAQRGLRSALKDLLLPNNGLAGAADEVVTGFPSLPADHQLQKVAELNGQGLDTSVLLAFLRLERLEAEAINAALTTGESIPPGTRRDVMGLLATGVDIGGTALLHDEPERHWEVRGLDSWGDPPGPLLPLSVRRDLGTEWLAASATSNWVQVDSTLLGAGSYIALLPISWRGVKPETVELRVRLACNSAPAWPNVGVYPDRMKTISQTSKTTLREIVLPPGTFSAEDAGLQIVHSTGQVPFETVSLRVEVSGTGEAVAVEPVDLIERAVQALVTRLKRVRREEWLAEERIIGVSVNPELFHLAAAGVSESPSLARQVLSVVLSRRQRELDAVAEQLRGSQQLTDESLLPQFVQRMSELANRHFKKDFSRLPFLDARAAATNRVAPCTFATDVLRSAADVISISASPAEPLSTWKLGPNSGYAGVGSYEQWRADLVAFSYPEANLAPSISPTKSQAFDDWAQTLKPRDPANYQLPSTPTEEDLYSFPMHAALHRYAQGRYMEAVNTINAHVFDDVKNTYVSELVRKNAALSESTFARPPVWWGGERVNPHVVAKNRRGAYASYVGQVLARSLLDHIEALLAQEDRSARARAKSLSERVQKLLGSLPDPRLGRHDGTPPAQESLGVRALRSRLQLVQRRILQGLSIAGGLSVARDDVRRELPPPPAEYRFAVLIERARRLAQVAQQVEGYLMNALGGEDEKNLELLRSSNIAEVATLRKDVSSAQVAEAQAGVSLAEARGAISRIEADHYAGLLSAGVSGKENEQLASLRASMGLQVAAGTLSASAAVMETISLINPLKWLAGGTAAGVAANLSSSFSAFAGVASTNASIAGTQASYERREQDWKLRIASAEATLIGNEKEVVSAKSRIDVATAEQKVVELEETQSDAVVDFLRSNTNLSAELYRFLIRTLSSAYSYFLSVATAAARLAEAQLAFERQTLPFGIIAADYRRPLDAVRRTNGTEQDTFGLTGSARLLEDIERIDEQAFETRRRKHRVAKTFSLARLFPRQFQEFRRTGILPFFTNMELFDAEFPGHYLRLLERVRLSFVALIPPPQGVAAMLHCSGNSRAVVKDGGFSSIKIRRSPSSVTIFQPISVPSEPSRDDAEFLDVFEGLGAETDWLLELAPAANPWNFDTLVDVLFTVEYTALFDQGYRSEVLAALPREVQSERLFSVKDVFPDQWYELMNAGDAATTLTLSFSDRDVLPNHLKPTIEAISLYLVTGSGHAELEFPQLQVRGGGQAGGVASMGRARTYRGILSTRLVTGAEWSQLVGCPLAMEWDLTVAPPLGDRDAVQDIVIAISYRATLTPWPTAWVG